MAGAMSQQMPTKGFRWLNDDKIVRDHGAILNLNDDAEDGFIYKFECTCQTDYIHCIPIIHSLQNVLHLRNQCCHHSSERASPLIRRKHRQI